MPPKPGSRGTWKASNWLLEAGVWPDNCIRLSALLRPFAQASVTQNQSPSTCALFWLFQTGSHTVQAGLDSPASTSPVLECERCAPMHVSYRCRWPFYSLSLHHVKGLRPAQVNWTDQGYPQVQGHREAW